MKLKNKDISLSLIKYMIWFLLFMLVESYVNTRVAEVISADKVELWYAIFILFTAAGFSLFGMIGKRIENKQLPVRVLLIICALLISVISFVDVSQAIIIGSAMTLLIIGFYGGMIMHKLSACYAEENKCGIALGGTMALAILGQYAVQNLVLARVGFVIILEALAVILLVLEVVKSSVSSDNKNKTNKLWLYIIATILMTIILSLNDAYLVDLSASSDDVKLFGSTRLFYCLSLVLAGIIYDYRKALYFNLSVACAMMLSTVAYVFLGNAVNYNVNMSIMYFYCGFYVMFLTVHFIKNNGADAATSCGYLIPGLGRVARCVTTSAVTFAMLILGNSLAVEFMIGISCGISILLFVLLASNDILIVKEKNRLISDSLVVSEPMSSFPNGKQLWDSFVKAYNFTEREKDVLEKLINTEDNIQDISEKLFISKRVVQRHITSIYEKTGRSTRIGLLQLYMNYISGSDEITK